MRQTKELNALFTLIDDPDEEVYSTISEKLLGFGTGIIPNLEHLWENTISEEVQERIEMLIHRLHYFDLTNEFIEWRDNASNDLLSGALLVSKFQYPALDTTPALKEIEKIKRNIWLELNHYLTPLEHANVLSSILYNYYKLIGSEHNYNRPEDFFIHNVLAIKKGNAISNGILYQVLCEELNINARMIGIPKQVVIAFYDSEYDPSTYKGHPQDNIHFYADAVSGQAFSKNDLDAYFKRINVTQAASYYKPLSNRQIIQLLMKELAKCFGNSYNKYKQTELLSLIKLLD